MNRKFGACFLSLTMVVAILGLLPMGSWKDAYLYGQQKKEPPTVKLDQSKIPKVEGKIDGSFKGKEIQQKTSNWKKQDKPNPNPPKDKPPEKKGGSWHWHPHYHSWVFLPLNVAPTTVVLPPTFVLPETVYAYEVAPVYITVICPHCGKPMLVQTNQ